MVKMKEKYKKVQKYLGYLAYTTRCMATCTRDIVGSAANGRTISS
jgi:hypothetical protein